MATTLAPPTPSAPPALDTRAQTAPTAVHIPTLAWVAVVVVLAWITYAFVGQNLFPNAWNHLHEFFHDGRHFLGIACH